MPEKRPHPGDQGDPNKRPKPSGDPVAAAKAAAVAKAAEIRARLAANKGLSNGIPSGPPPVPAARAAPAVLAPAPAASGGMSRLEAMKARTAALLAASKIEARGATPTHGAPSAGPAPIAGSDAPTPETDVGSSSATPAPEGAEAKPNPYLVQHDGPGGRKRPQRELLFNSFGKYVEQGSRIRAQNRLEQIKKEIARKSRLAGLDENSERGFMVQKPPPVEWWDEGLVDEKTYDCIDDASKVKIDGDDSIITIYVQHPPMLKAPQDKRLIEVKPMYRTRKEEAKLRRMNRAENLKEQRDLIRLGLQPPPPPKIKRGNMMRVMGEQAIADPTAVEMLVEAQIKERHDNHMKANEDRKLTKEQRLAKLEANQQKDAQKGLYMCVFKVDNLSFGKHRYQIDLNAKQHALTGIILYNPKMNLVIVEGGVHSINKYKKLMLYRIKWTENAAPAANQIEKQASDPEWMRSYDPDGKLKDLSNNKCSLVFEGEVKERAFRKWGSKICESDGEARQLLLRSKLDSLWAFAKTSEEVKVTR